MNHKKSINIIAATAGVLAILTYGFIINKARNEVYYLCGNFAEGVPYSSVTRQLDTITLSDYTVQETDLGTRIIHSSPVNSRLVSCTIEFDSGGEVISADYQAPW